MLKHNYQRMGCHASILHALLFGLCTLLLTCQASEINANQGCTGDCGSTTQTQSISTNQGGGGDGPSTEIIVAICGVLAALLGCCGAAAAKGSGGVSVSEP
jgi:hypothetical protein